MTDTAVTFEWSLEGSSVSSPYFTDCGKGYKTKRVLGGYQKFGTDVFIRKTLTDIPPHYQSNVQVNMYYIDTWSTSESIWINYDGTNTEFKYQAAGQTLTDSETNCGGVAIDYIQTVATTWITHTSSTHQIIFKSNLQQDSAVGSWGIRDFIYTIRACDKSCLSCTSAMQGNQCQTCYPNSTIVGNLCQCDPYYYPYFPESTICTKQPCMICKQCDDSCYTCTGPYSNNCSSCTGSNIGNINKHRYLLDTSCVDTCRDGTYKNPALNNNLCSNCHTSCKTCSGGNDYQKCTSCSSPNYLNLDNSCQSSCPNYYYGVDLPARICSICASHCLHCTGPNANQCTECEAGYFLYSNQCNLTCPTHYFKNSANKTCDKCHDSCNNCTGNQNYQCTDCNGLDFLDSLSTPGKSFCVATCQDRYFGDTSQTPRICRDCSESCSDCNCFQCTVLNVCTACQSPYYLVGSKCQSCQDGYYGDSLTQVCKPCNESCTKCAGGTSQNCTECKPSMFLYILSGIQGRCLDVCPSTPPRFGQNRYCVSNCNPGFYGDSEDPLRMCKSCDTKCSLCYGAGSNSCTSCQVGYFLNNNSCQSVCPDGKYQNTVTSTCDLCNEYCGTCNGPLITNCLTCAPPLYGTGSVCNSICPAGTYGDPITRTCNSFCNPGFYKDEKNRVCLVCNQKCQTCTGPQATNCLICKAPYFDNNGQCDECPLSKYGIVDVADGSKRKCIDCPTFCAVCTSPGPVCQQCVPGRKLSSNSCLLSCPSSTFSHPVTEVCVAECPLGYYGDTTQNICSQCASRCGKCYGQLQENCYQCVHPYYLHNTECILSCPQGYFADNLTWNCIKCPENCSQCNSSDSCLVCSINYFLYNSVCVTSCPTDLYEREGECVSDCGKGFYVIKSSATKKCGVCSRFCVECVDEPTKCTSCKYSLNTKLYLQGNVCQLKCDEGYFLPSYSQNVCTQCDKMCQNCIGTSTNCLTCRDPYFSYNGKCVLECPSPLQGYQNQCLDCFPGFYYDSDIKACSNKTQFQFLECHISCKQCTGKRYDQCTKCWNYRGQGLDNAPIDGICECQDGYTEMFDRLCKGKNLNFPNQINDEASSKISSVKGLSITNTVFELIFYVLSSNPVSFIMMANLGQHLNMISYLDMPYGFKLQETVRHLGKYHITQGLGAPAFVQKDRLKMNQENEAEQEAKTINDIEKRILYETYNTWSDRKFEKNNFTGSFLSNMIIFFSIQGFVWLFCYLLKRHIIKKELDHHSFIYHLNLLITYNLPLALFMLSFFEVIISIFLQFKLGDFSSAFNNFSFVCSLFGLAYVAFIVENYIEVMNYKKPFEKPEVLEEEYNQKRIFWIYLRLDHVLQRNFHLIVFIHKTIVAAILVFMYDASLIAQASLILVTYILMLAYLIICKPLNRKRYLFLQIFNEFFTCIIWILLIVEAKSQESSIVISNIDRSYHIHNIILMLFIAHFLFIIFEFIVNIPLLIQRYKMARSIAIEQISHFIEWLNRRNIQKRQNFLLKMLNQGQKDYSIFNIDENKTNQSRTDNYHLQYEQDYVQLLTGHDLKNIKSGGQDEIVDLEIDEEEINLIKQQSKLKANNLNLLIPDINITEVMINNNGQKEGQSEQQRAGGENKKIEASGIRGEGEGLNVTSTVTAGINKEQQKLGLRKDEKGQLSEIQLINLDLLKDKPQEKIVLDKELILPNINLQRKAQTHHRVYLKDELQVDRFKVFGEFRGNKFTLSMQGRPHQTDLNNGLYDIYEYDEFMNEVLLKDENEDSFEVIDFMDRNKQYYSNKLGNNQSSRQLGNSQSLIQSQLVSNKFSIFPDKNKVEEKFNNVNQNPFLKRQLELDDAASQVRSYMDMETQGKFKILKKKDVNTGRVFTIALPLSADIQHKRQALANKILSMKPNAIIKESNDINSSSLSHISAPNKKINKSTVLNAWQQSQSNIYQNQKKW